LTATCQTITADCQRFSVRLSDCCWMYAEGWVKSRRSSRLAQPSYQKCYTEWRWAWNFNEVLQLVATVSHRTSKVDSDLIGSYLCRLTQFLRWKSGAGLRMFRHKFWAARQKLCLLVHCPRHIPPPTLPAHLPLTQALRRLELANFLPVPSPKLYLGLGFFEGWELSPAQMSVWPFCVININSSLLCYIWEVCCCIGLQVVAGCTVSWDIQCPRLEGRYGSWTNCVHVKGRRT